MEKTKKCKAFFATAGGNDVSGLGKVVEKGKNLV
jgi:hypothetical protein